MPWLLETHLWYIGLDAWPGQRSTLRSPSRAGIERFATQWKRRRGSPGRALPTNDLLSGCNRSVSCRPTQSRQRTRRRGRRTGASMARVRPCPSLRPTACGESGPSKQRFSPASCLVASPVRARCRDFDAGRSGVTRVLSAADRATGGSLVRGLCSPVSTARSPTRKPHCDSREASSPTLPARISLRCFPPVFRPAPSRATCVRAARFEPREPMNLDGDRSRPHVDPEDWQRRRAYEQVHNNNDVIFRATRR